MLFLHVYESKKGVTIEKSSRDGKISRDEKQVVALQKSRRDAKIIAIQNKSRCKNK